MTHGNAPPFHPVHDRGQVLVDTAVMLADGGETIADIDVFGGIKPRRWARWRRRRRCGGRSLS